MVILEIEPSSLVGRISLPPSKSQTMRALLFASLAKGKSRLHHCLRSPDTLAMVRALRQFGVEIADEGESVEMLGRPWEPCADVIDVGNSGQILRFVGSLAALLPTYTVLTGDHSIRNLRPVAPLLSGLSQLGAFAVSSRCDGSPPLILRGPLEPGSATLCGKDSQPVSGLLMVTAFLPGTTYLTVTEPGERPWVDLTLSWLKRLGARVSHEAYSRYIIEGPLSYEGFDMQIPGDLSAAAFPLVAALLTDSEVTLENVDLGDAQGDKRLIALLSQMGARLEVGDSYVMVQRGGSLVGGEVDVNDMIDSLPILAVLGCFVEGGLRLVNGAIARRKESDRIHAIARELQKMGAEVEERADGLVIAPSLLRGSALVAHRDHRIAMALAVAALAAKGSSRVEGVECIDKSYPSFVRDFQSLGARFAEHHSLRV